jgi:hypothetical protein
VVGAAVVDVVVDEVVVAAVVAEGGPLLHAASRSAPTPSPTAPNRPRGRTLPTCVSVRCCARASRAARPAQARHRRQRTRRSIFG